MSTWEAASHNPYVQVLRRSKSSGLKRLRKRGKIEAIDADEDITLVDVDTKVYVNADIKERIIQEEVNAVEPTVFDDEKVTMTMAQTLIKMKPEKARLLDEKMAKRLHDEEVEQAAENIDWNVIAEQIQEKHLDNIKKNRSLEGKPISINQARKNMIIYLKNMARYKMKHFREEPQTKRVNEETLLQESFKKLKAVEVSEKDYPLSDAVMILMLSEKLQVDEDCEMARDLVMKIFMESNKPKRRSLDTSSK
nr:hypothetical protein [Tanacetum cinerariifolium]